jgi:hypothetical protein
MTEEDVGNYGAGVLGSWSGLGHSISPVDILQTVHDSGGILALGDSILYATVTDLATRANNHGTNFAVNAWSGRPTTPAVDWLQSNVVNANLMPGTLLMCTGTNDVFDPSVFDPAAVGQVDQLERVMALVGPDLPVWWVTVYVGRFDATAAVREAQVRNSGWINGQLHEAASRHPNLHIIDWYRFLAQGVTNGSPPQDWRIRSGLVDGVHTTAWGSDARNDLIEAAIWPA